MEICRVQNQGKIDEESSKDLNTKSFKTTALLQKNISSYCLSVICEMLKELVRASFSGALKNNENNSSFDTMTQGHPEMKLICLDFSKHTERSTNQAYSLCFLNQIILLINKSSLNMYSHCLLPNKHN